MVTAASSMSKMFYAYRSCCSACSASSNPSRRVYNEGVTPNESYYVPRRNEGWATHGLPFREMPAGGTGENRMAVALPAQSISE